MALLGVTFASIETTYLAANFGKLDHGGWLPLLLATAIFSLMTTWRRGRDIVNNRRREAEEPLTQFVDRFVRAGALRVPGIAIFPHADPHTTPLALARNLAYNHVLHQQVVVVSVRTTNVPHVDPGRRITIEHPSKDLPGLTCVRACIGFLDRADLPEILRPVLADIGGGRTPASICYFLSRVVLYAGPHTEMSRLRTHMFIALAHNAASQVDYFQLPIDRTVVLGSQVIL